VIFEIKFHEWAQERCTKLSFWVEPSRGETVEKNAEELFKTEEECQKMCDELNSKVIPND